jgi:hypothetical protein
LGVGIHNGPRFIKQIVVGPRTFVAFSNPVAQQDQYYFNDTDSPYTWNTGNVGVGHIMVGTDKGFGTMYGGPTPIAHLIMNGIGANYIIGQHQIGEKNDGAITLNPYTQILMLDDDVTNSDVVHAINNTAAQVAPPDIQPGGKWEMDEDLDRLYVAGTYQTPKRDLKKETYFGLLASNWGSAVDIVGNTVYVGAAVKGRVATYDLGATDFTHWTAQVGGFEDTPLRSSSIAQGTGNFGTELAAVTSTTAIAGQTSDGVNYVQPVVNGALGTQRPLVAAAGFGGDETLDVAGNRLLVGAPDDRAGSLLMFDVPSDNTWLRSFFAYQLNSGTNVMERVPSTTTSLDFGRAPQMISEGFVIAGTGNADTLANKVYNFRRGGPSWTPLVSGGNDTSTLTAALSPKAHSATSRSSVRLTTTTGVLSLCTKWLQMTAGRSRPCCSPAA